jgi:histone H3/H4
VSEAEAQALLDAADDEDGTPPGPTPQRRVVTTATTPRASEESEQGGSESETDVLIVVSKLKKYVRDRSGMNTSDSVVQVLSDHVRALCREAIRQAGQDGRRTVLDRDFTKVLAQLDTAAQQRGEGNFRSQR